jgi:PST family polysaccharide transporter/lipopolysaccharide exporter
LAREDGLDLDVASGPPLDRTRTLRAFSWSAAATVAGAALVLARSAVLARLLRPEQFGLFGLVVLVLTAVATFTDLGLQRATLVQHFGDAAEQARYLDTSFTAQVLLGAALSLLIAVLAWPYAAAMSEPRLGPLLAAASVSPLLLSLYSPGLLLLQRDLDQRPLVLLKLGADAAGLLITAVLALRLRSAWALVLGFLGGPALGVLASWWVRPWRLRLRFDRAQFGRGLGQGRHLVVVGALTFVTTQMDNLIVGRLAGAAALGLYLFAYRLCSLPIDLIQQAIGGVALPAYAKLRVKGATALVARHQTMLTATTAAICGALLPAALLRRELVELLGGARWLPAADLLPPLFLLAVLRVPSIQHGTLLLSLERADLDARAKLLEACFFVSACVLGVRAFGLLGACWAGAATYALTFLQRSVAAEKVLPGEGRHFFVVWARIALPALGCAAAGLGAERLGFPSLLVAPGGFLLWAALSLRLEPALPTIVRTVLLRR